MSLSNEVVREEKTTRRWARQFVAHGGQLSLARHGLVWRKSGRRQKPMEFTTTDAWFGLGPRRPNYVIMVFAPLYGIFSEVISGGLRQTLEVRTNEEFYWFSVKDVSGWLEQIAAIGGRIVPAE